VAGYRNFCNKLWNAARFVLRALQNRPSCRQAASMYEQAAISVSDRWIRSRLGATISAVDDAFRDYRFDFAASALYEFTWHEFCDWYLEIVKPVLQLGTRARTATARRTLLAVLETLLRAAASADAVHHRGDLAARGAHYWPASAARASCWQPWPQARRHFRRCAAEQELHWVMQVVLGIRQIRGEMDISSARRLPLLLQHATEHDLALIRATGLLCTWRDRPAVRALAKRSEPHRRPRGHGRRT
jgi:valyl-tRNA synthetase